MGKDIERQEITLPHDSDAERNVLSGMLLEPDQLPALGLTPSDFFDAWHRDIFKAMDELVQLAHAGDGTNIIVVQHTNKNDEDKRPGGSIAFTASADVILHLSVEGPDRRRVLSGVKNRFDERYLLEPTVIGLNQTTGHIEAKGTKAEAVYKDVSADMLTALSNGPMMQVDLLDAVTAKTGGKSKTVIRLEEVGKIERKREGKGYLCSLKETSSAPSLRFPRGGEALNMPALPLPPLIEGGEGAEQM